MRHRLRTSLIALALLLGLLAVMPGASADPAPAAAHSLALPLVTRKAHVGLMYAVNQRFGVGLAPSYPRKEGFPGKLSDFPGVTDLGFGWYSNWLMEMTPERPEGVEFVQLVDTREEINWTRLRNAVLANPRSLWIIGNEPEVASQGSNTPEEYADIYHETYHLIKEADPTARIAIGGVVMPSPLRLLWLDEALSAYQAKYGTKMPVDVWNIHVQILPEGLSYGCFLPYGLSMPEAKQRELVLNHGASGDPQDPDYYYFAYNADPAIFEQLVRAMRSWMAQHGERDKPLIISEYGVLFPSTYLANHLQEGQQEAGDQMVIGFMQETFDFMLTATDPEIGFPADGNRLVQRWLWFSINVPPYACYDDDPLIPGPDGGYCEGFNGSLYRWYDRSITIFGEAYRDYVTAARAGTLSSLPRMHVAPPDGPVERSPLPPSGLPDLTKRPPYYGRP